MLYTHVCWKGRCRRCFWCQHERIHVLQTCCNSSRHLHNFDSSCQWYVHQGWKT